MDQEETRVTTSHWGAFGVTTRAKRIIGVRPFPADPQPSEISLNVPSAVHHRARIDQPYVRRGWLEKSCETSRGEDEYIPMAWEDALDLAAKEIERIISTHGNHSIFGGSYGWASAGRFHHAQSQVHRFLNCLGGYVSSDLSPKSPPRILRVLGFVCDLMRPVFPEPFSWRTRWA
jgi:biotin/methionine sulfoxide reductase